MMMIRETKKKRGTMNRIFSDARKSLLMQGYDSRDIDICIKAMAKGMRMGMFVGLITGLISGSLSTIVWFLVRNLLI